MWIFRLQVMRFRSSKTGALMLLGATLMGLLFLTTGNGRQSVKAYFFLLIMLFALFSPFLTSQVPEEVITLSKPAKRSKVLLEHLIAVLALSIVVLSLATLLALPKSAPREILKGMAVDLGYITALSAAGLLVGALTRGVSRWILSIAAGFALLFVPMGLAILGKTTLLWRLLIPTLSPFLSTIGETPVAEGLVQALVFSIPYVLGGLILYGRSEVR